MEWLPIWGPSIAAVIVAAAFTWVFGVVNERQHRQGMRALVAHEVWHNLSVLRATRQYLESCINAADPTQRSPAVSPVSFVMTPAPLWQHSRWDLPDVGVAFTAKELEELATWYWELADFKGVYETTIAAMKLPPAGSEPGPVSSEDAEILVGGLTILLKMVNSLIEAAPRSSQTVAALRAEGDGPRQDNEVG